MLTFTDVLEAAWRHEYVLNWIQSAPTGRRSASGSCGVGARKPPFCRGKRPVQTIVDIVYAFRNVSTKPDQLQDLHIILENLSTHKTPAVHEWLDAHPRIHLHFTPTSSSWLNAVEGWFAQLERRALYRGVFTSVPALKAELRRFTKVHNSNSAKPFKWTKPASNIIAAVGRAKPASHH